MSSSQTRSGQGLVVLPLRAPILGPKSFSATMTSATDTGLFLIKFCWIHFEIVHRWATYDVIQALGLLCLIELALRESLAVLTDGCDQQTSSIGIDRWWWHHIFWLHWQR